MKQNLLNIIIMEMKYLNCYRLCFESNIGKCVVVGMKKMNSINYGGKVIVVGLIIMLLIPSILLWLYTFWRCKCIVILAGVLFVIGMGILIGFAVLLFIELRQDKRIDKYYSEHKNVKIKLDNGKYECGVCGNRAIRADSLYCNMCGCKYESNEDRTPQEILEFSNRNQKHKI